MLIGYARVSSHDQNLDLQIKALKKAGCKKIFDDKTSGSRSVRAASVLLNRPGLAKAMEMLRDGDSLVVWKLVRAASALPNRLGRSVKHLVNLVGELREKGVEFRSLTITSLLGKKYEIGQSIMLNLKSCSILLI
jgi:DNA invertase Pin-like site-specific DNA recombinase